jgi:hypothetical protein
MKPADRKTFSIGDRWIIEADDDAREVASVVNCRKAALVTATMVCSQAR